MKNSRAIIAALTIGLLVGVFLPNIYKTGADRIGIAANLALLGRYIKEPTEYGTFFLYVLKYRGISYLMVAVFGLSVFGVPISILCTGIMGALVGGTLTSMFIQGGLTGFLAGLLFLLPHYLLYIPVSLRFYTCSYELSLGQWKGRSKTSVTYGKYVRIMLLLFLLLLIGIFLESYVNPFLLQICANKFKIF